MAADMQDAIQPEFFQQYSIEHLRKFSSRELEHAGRITHPLLLESGATHYAPISWDDVFNRIGTKLKITNPDRFFSILADVHPMRPDFISSYLPEYSGPTISTIALFIVTKLVV